MKNQTPSSVIGKKKRNPLVIGGCVVGAIVLWFIAAYFYGPNSEHGLNERIDQLKRDSIALQGNFKPGIGYTYVQDLSEKLDELKKLGNPLRFGSTKEDSIRLYDNPRTAELARYNIAKCDSVLNDVLPLYRASAMFALDEQFKREVNKNVIIRPIKDTEYRKIEIFSPSFLTKKKIEEVADQYNPYLRDFRFEEITYAASPDSPGVTYTFEYKK